MNILLLVLNWVGKGTYWRALHFGRELVARGHTVTLVATSRRARVGIQTYDVDGVTLVETPDLFRGPLRSGWDLWNVANRVAWMHGRRFDVVHAFEARPTVLFPALFAQRLQKVPLVMDWADWFGRGGAVEQRSSATVRAVLRPVETFFEETFRTWANGTTVICTTLREKVLELGVPPSSVVLLPNGSETEWFHPVAHGAARHRVGLPIDGPLIGHVGTAFPDDAALMARAFNLVHRERADTRLLVVGYCPTDVRALVAAPESVIQTGFVDERDLNDYLAACDVCWLPLKDTNANRGRWPLKLNDYLAVGRPVIATAVGDVAVLLGEEAVGLLAEDRPISFAQQTLRLLTDTDARRTMGRCARHVAETKFSWRVLTDELEAVYERVIARCATSRHDSRTKMEEGHL